MAKKSKTQRAKASARRAEKKEQNQLAAEAPVAAVEEKKEQKKSKLFGSKSSSSASSKADNKKASKPAAKKPGFFARRFAFLKDVRAEMRRVTWPSRIDVIRWSGVVVVALLFFSLYVFVLDNWIVTPLLVAISSLGA